MTARNQQGQQATPLPDPSTYGMNAPAQPAAYVKGSHTASIRVDHDERRTALLARDEVLDGEIRRRQEERDDINEALRLLSDPGASNVVPLTSAAQ